MFDTFGELSLFSMSTSGQRGLFSQLYISGDSINHLGEKDDALTTYLEAILEEYTNPPPRAKLQAWRDGREQGWKTRLYSEPHVFRLRRVPYGKHSTPPDKREYYVSGWGRSIGTAEEIASFIKASLGVEEFILDIYDPISEPDRNLRLEFGGNVSSLDG